MGSVVCEQDSQITEGETWGEEGRKGKEGEEEGAWPHQASYCSDLAC